MAEFYLSVPEADIASQIAKLLNRNNLLYKIHTAKSVQNSAAIYFFEAIQSRIIGCTAIVKESSEITRSLHTCVDPKFRNLKIASKLLATAINNCSTAYMYAMIRENNLPSIKLYVSLGFRYMNKELSKSRDHYLIKMWRNVNNGRLRVQHRWSQERVYNDL